MGLWWAAVACREFEPLDIVAGIVDNPCRQDLRPVRGDWGLPRSLFDRY